MSRAFLRLHSQCNAELGVCRAHLTSGSLLCLPGDAEEGLGEGGSGLHPPTGSATEHPSPGGPPIATG